MSYKIKSLLYFVAFVISAIILQVTDNQEESTLAQKNHQMDQAITDNSQTDNINEAELISEVRLEQQ